MSHKILCTELKTGGAPLYHVGPALDHGPLPSIFYFALSGPDSLCLDPYNQPVQFLSSRQVRFFSCTLPAHESGLSPNHALAVWAEEMKKGIDCIGNFLDNVQRAVKFTIHQKLVGHLGLMGLSRGGLVASLLAAREERFKAMVQFAPVTKIVHTKEFQHMESNPLVQSLDPFALADRLANRPSRFYVGNRDARVGTKNCVEFAMLLAERSTLRSPPIELIVSPSIGSQGHGTSPEIFRQGAEWLADCLQ